MSARATATRCACPPETSPGSEPATCSTSTRSSHSRAPVVRVPAAQAGEPQRQGDVLQAGQLGDELAELEHEAELGAAERLRSASDMA